MKKGLILYKKRLYIPNVTKIKLLIFNEIHKTPYLGHPGYQKTNHVKEGLFLSKHEE